MIYDKWFAIHRDLFRNNAILFKKPSKIIINLFRKPVPVYSIYVTHPTEQGKAVVTPLLYGPVDNTQLHDRSFFQSQKAVANECQVDVLMCTVQLPSDASMPTGKGDILGYMYDRL